jgi:hypothetical protein
MPVFFGELVDDALDGLDNLHWFNFAIEEALDGFFESPVAMEFAEILAVGHL